MLPLRQETVKQLFDYIPETGEFIRLKTTSHNAKKGQITKGSKDHYGRYVLSINNKQYKAHRIAWVYSYGEIPEGLQIDHINGDHSDNRLCNLRICTGAENMQNMKKKQNKYGLTGVEKHRRKWQAYIWKDRKKTHLGMFSTKEDAYKAYLEAKKIFHTFNPIPRYEL